MDKTKIKNLQDSIKHYNMFLRILNDNIKIFNNDNSKENINEIVNLLVNQHTMNRITLENLGYNFDENKTISNLSQRIFDLEKEIGADGKVDFSKISKFINYMNKFISERLELNYGLICYPKISVGESVNITLEHLKIYLPATESDYSYANNDDEKKFIIDKHMKAYNIAKNIFDVSENNGEILFNSKNNNKLNMIIQDVFAEYGNIINLEHNLVNYFNQNDGLKISSIKFVLVTLVSHLIYSETSELL